MLTEKDIDLLKSRIQNGEQPILYYVADYNETRDNNVYNAANKTHNKYKVIEVKIKDIHNAYFEYLNYVNDTEGKKYHVEEEVEHYDYKPENAVIHRYIVPNGKKSYSKDINPRIPSIIYGEKKIYNNFNDSGETLEYVSPSPIKPIYTNVLSFNGLSNSEIKSLMDNHKLDWKYMTLEQPTLVDGIEYDYITTNWFYLETVNYPTIEYPLIIIGENSSYFMSLENAWNFVRECEA